MKLLRIEGLGGGAVAVALLFADCAVGETRAPAELRLLERERANLVEMLEAPADSPLVARGDVIVALRSELFESVLGEALPQSGAVGDRFRMTLRSARVRLGDGLARVEMEGRAALRDDSTVHADVLVVGLLDVVDLDAAAGVLRVRVEILGIDTRRVGVRGLAPPAERLVDALARSRAEEFNDLLSDLEVPVSLRERVELPAVESRVVTTAGGELPLSVRLSEVRTLAGRLWVVADVEVGEPRPAPLARSWWEGG